MTTWRHWSTPGSPPHASWFQEFVLRDGPWSPDVTVSVRAVPLAARGDAGAFAGTHENIAARRYPLVRSMFIRLHREANAPLPPPVREFLRFVLSHEGQDMVRTSGYFPLDEEEAAAERVKLN